MMMMMMMMMTMMMMMIIISVQLGCRRSHIIFSFAVGSRQYLEAVHFDINLLAPELFFLVLAHPVYKM